MFCLYVLCLCTKYIADARGQNRRAMDHLELELGTVVSHHVGAWALNSGLLQEQVLLIAEPSLQPQWFVCFLNRVLLSSPGWPGLPSVEQAGLKLTETASQALALKAFVFIPGSLFYTFDSSPSPPFPC